MALGTRVQDRIFNRLRELRDEMELTILKQVPQPGQNPYATGALKSSLTVKVEKQGGGDFAIRVGYLRYGIFTNLGTRDYNVVKFGSRGSGAFDLPVFRGYQRGTYGVQPQYWTSMGGAARSQRLKRQLLADMKDEIKLYFKTRTK
jgi:hypothetical protein